MADAQVTLPYLFPNWIVALLPATYGWQVFGWGTGLGLFVAVWIILTMATVAAVAREWSFRRLKFTLAALIICLMMAIWLGGTSTCDQDGCRWWLPQLHGAN